MKNSEKILEDIELDILEWVNSDIEKRKKMLPLMDKHAIKSIIWNLFISSRHKYSYNDYSEIMNILIERLKDK